MNETKNLTDFDNYLLKEYEIIAEAHFRSIETISAFFRYYVLIMSIPISAIVFLFQKGGADLQLISNVLRVRIFLIGFIISVAVVGIFLCMYIINLRLDAIQYARVINGIRNYFFDISPHDLFLKKMLTVLPRSPYYPSYFEKSVFLPVVLAFTIFNGFYFFVGFWLLFYPRMYLIFLLTLLLLVFQVLIYYFFARHREIGYLKSNIIGVDIDGVLNKHRGHFCRLLKEKTGKTVEPEKITCIPVHEIPSLDVSRDDERKVFNDPTYWIDMPPDEKAPDVIRRLKNIMNFKIYIFTYRPWPDEIDEKKLFDLVSLFMQKTNNVSLKMFLLHLGIKFKMSSIVRRFKSEPMRQITVDWLRKNSILFDRLYIELGNDFSSDPRVKFINRFFLSRKKKIRFFVEDELDKAIKLSYICDLVFLIDHPYNQGESDHSRLCKGALLHMPSNVIRVSGWDEIWKYIKKVA
uniref:Uncharacterized protein n=1 Tax=candidate division WOR-3 bacterium TaxID=2052148 RepID=A0A7V4E5I0_UNCW3